MINKGYPHNCTNYAISLGRGNNTGGTTNAGNGTQFGNFVPGTNIFSGGLSFYIENMSAVAYASPSNSNTGYVCQYRYSGLKIARIFGIPVPYTSVRVKNIRYTGINPYDDAPGGFERSQAQFVNSFNTNTGFLNISYRGGASAAQDFGHFGHDFVPVASALDLQNQTYGSATYFQSSNLYYNIDNIIQTPGTLTGNTLSTPSYSPFKAVLTATSDCAGETCISYAGDDPAVLAINGINQLNGANWNQWHESSISNQAALFLQRKILNTTSYPGCTSTIDFCSSTFSVTGPSTLCTTGTYTLNSTAPLNNATIYWSFPNNTVSITSGQGTKTITVLKTLNGTDNATVKITNTCGLNSSYSMPISVGTLTPVYMNVSTREQYVMEIITARHIN